MENQEKEEVEVLGTVEVVDKKKGLLKKGVQFVKDHFVDIAFGTFMAVVGGASIASIRRADKRVDKAVNKQLDMMNEEHEARMDLYNKAKQEGTETHVNINL